MNIKNVLTMLLVAVCGGLVSVFMYTQIHSIKEKEMLYANSNSGSHPHLHLASYEPYAISGVSFPDLTFAAEKAVHCVVHVRVKSMQEFRNPLMEFFYGPGVRQQVPREGFGSGVIISSDGYIITNNHVISRSDEIEVLLNDGRVFNASVVGADSNTDLALLKIEENNLPFLTFGDSQAIRVGEWVLAVGNPLNLTSTVTAGIVSAKSRYLGVNSHRGHIGAEAFIQTDAAVNQGNSGGALVNIHGELIGINTLIVSQTGGFSGNSFAIPSIIVEHVVSDLKEFGSVQRALLGIMFTGPGGNFSNETPELTIVTITENFGAAEAGIKVGDVMTAINDVSIKTFAEFQEQIVRYRPSEIVKISVLRDNKTQHFNVILRNNEGTTQVLQGDNHNMVLGARFESIPQRERQSLGINSGIKVGSVGQGMLSSLGIRNGFIITAVNDKPVNSARDIQNIVDAVESGGRILINAVDTRGQVVFYVTQK